MSKSKYLASHGVQRSVFALLTLMIQLARLAPFVEPPGRQAATLADTFLNEGSAARKPAYYVITCPKVRRMRRSHGSRCSARQRKLHHPPPSTPFIARLVSWA